MKLLNDPLKNRYDLFIHKNMAKYKRLEEKKGCDGDISTTLKFKPCPRHHNTLLQ